MTVLPLSMRRNHCNLELRLLPSSASLPFDSDDNNQNHHHPMMEESNTISPQQQKQMTIFYNGQVCVCDATELQARAIIMLARREMEERMNKKIPTTGKKQPSSPSLQSQAPYSPTTGGLSMKRSLQRFLQKRNHRIHETSSPYHR